MSDRVLTTTECASYCCVAPQAVGKWIDKGFLRGRRLPGSKHRQVQADDLMSFMRVHNMPVPSELIAETISIDKLFMPTSYVWLDSEKSSNGPVRIVRMELKDNPVGYFICRGTNTFLGKAGKWCVYIPELLPCHVDEVRFESFDAAARFLLVKEGNV